MGYQLTALLWATAAAMAVALEPSAVQSKESNTAARGKRTLEFFPPIPRSYGAAERRISTGPTATSRVAISTHYFDRGTPPITIRHQTRVPTHHTNVPNRRTRPHSVPAPPYAVQMEPLVQYSQRDPLYHQQKQVSSGKTSEQSSFNDLQQVKKSSAPLLSLEHPPKTQHFSSSDLSLASLPTSIEQETSRTDHDLTNQIPRDELLPFHDSEPSAGQFASQHLYPYEENPYYLREPEPIIEIIVKESNITLPPPPTPPTPPSRPPTKEPVQVFYVKYKKESSKYGKEGGIIYDPPIPAITPASNTETEAHYPAASEVSTHPPTPPPPPPPTTTLRTIIRPDSETFHGSGLHVTFGDPNDEESHEDYQQQSAPHPSVIFPQQNFNLRKSVGPTQRPNFLPPHEHHNRQPEPFQQQPPVSLHQPPHHPFNQQHQNQFPPHQPPFQRPFNPPPFHQQRQPPFQQPPHLSHPPPPFNQPPAPFRHLPPSLPPLPPPQHQPPQKPNFHQSFQQPPFPFQPPRQPPPSQSPPQSNQRPQQILQVQQSQQVPLPSLRPNFRESLQRPPFQSQNLQHRPHFPSPSPAPDQRKPGLPPQQPPVFPTRAEQQRINAPPHPNIHQPIQPPQHQQQNQQQHQQLLQQQHQQQQFQQQQLQLQQLQQQRLQFQQQQQQQQQQFQQHQQLPQLQKQQSFNQQQSPPFNQQQSIPPQLFSQGNKENPFSGEIVKSISQQLHLTPTEQSTQQQFPNGNQPSLLQKQQQLLQQQLQQQQFQQQQLQQQFQQQQQSHFPHQQVPNSISTPTPVFQQSTINQQFPQSQSIPTHQQFQQRPATPATNNFTTPHKLFSFTPTTTQAPTTVITSKAPETKTEATNTAEDEKKTQTALAALPDEVPEDLRQQLLSSGILSNADIQILDYDKVGDIPIENLPPHALENFYGAAGSVGAASAPVPQVVALNDSKTPVEMKVVRYDPSTAEGQEVAEKYVREDATQVDPVVLNDSKYNRYLPLKVNGAQFPVPDVPELRGRNVTSVVVLAPVDYDFRKPNHTVDDSDREGRSTRVEVQGVQFVAGDVLKELVKEPTVENYKKWLEKENSTEADRQSIVLLVVGTINGNSKDIYMYDVGTQKVSRLRGELSSAFVDVAEANANSQELDSLAAASDILEHWEQSPFDLESGEEPAAAASEIQEQIILPSGVDIKDLSSSLSTKQVEVPASGDLVMTASEPESTTQEDSSGDKISNTIIVSSGYSKTSDFTGPAI